LASCAFSLFPRLKGRHFGTTGAMEGELREVLNTQNTTSRMH
jgi:hypothetical protein